MLVDGSHQEQVIVQDKNNMYNCIMSLSEASVRPHPSAEQLHPH